ncbi:DUF2306 domain-containing protein [Maricaulis sp. CAU 1757]
MSDLMPAAWHYLTVIHIIAGSVAVIAGALALAAPKGRPLHRAGGNVFAVAMTVSTIPGIALGVAHAGEFYITAHAGILALYLVASGRHAARSRSALERRPVRLLAIVNAANLAGLAGLALLAMFSASGRVLGFPPTDYMFLAVLVALGLGGDLRVLFHPRLSRPHRIARHLWRLCLAYFIAVGSAFTGPGASAFPEALQQSGLLALPELVTLALLLFWLAYTLWPRRRSTGAESAR